MARVLLHGLPSTCSGSQPGGKVSVPESAGPDLMDEGLSTYQEQLLRRGARLHFPLWSIWARIGSKGRGTARLQWSVCGVYNEERFGSGPPAGPGFRCNTGAMAVESGERSSGERGPPGGHVDS